MSSYLVGLVVSDFTCINGIATEAGLKGDLPIRVCARPNVPRGQLLPALDVAIRIIESFQKLYGVSFPLPKCGNKKNKVAIN